MARIVQKFGGTSVGDIERIKNVAEKVKAEVSRGNEVAVVVSAMAGVTNQLVDYCGEIAPLYEAREYDAVVASGEQVTSGLAGNCLQADGISARSWQGWQIPIRTDEVHGKARIVDIDPTGAGQPAKPRRGRRDRRVPRGLAPGPYCDVGPRRIGTLPPWPWRRHWRLTDVTSIPMWTASTPAIHASCARPANSIRLPMKRCLKWRHSGYEGASNALGRNGHEAWRAGPSLVEFQRCARHFGC